MNPALYQKMSEQGVRTWLTLPADLWLEILLHSVDTVDEFVQMVQIFRLVCKKFNRFLAPSSWTYKALIKAVEPKLCPELLWMRDEFPRTMTQVGSILRYKYNVFRLVGYLRPHELPRPITNLTGLDCRETISILPPEIGALSNLQLLNLSQHRITTIPPEIGSLSRLQSLLLINNYIRVLPDEIGALSSLEFLDLEGNQLTKLPTSICNLGSKLKFLDLRRNILEGPTPPPEIWTLVALTDLNLSANPKISELPPQIGRLIALTDLCLKGTNLCSLPDEIGMQN